MADIADQPFLGLEKALDAVEHVVEGAGQAANFAGVVGVVNAVAQVARARNGAGCLGDGVDGGQGAPRQKGADDGSQDNADGSAQDEVAVDLRQRRDRGSDGLDDLERADHFVLDDQRDGVDQKGSAVVRDVVVVIVLARQDILHRAVLFRDGNIAQILGAFHHLAVDVEQLRAKRRRKQLDLWEKDRVGAGTDDDDVALHLLDDGGGDVARLGGRALLQLEAQVGGQRRIDRYAKQDEGRAEEGSVP